MESADRDAEAAIAAAERAGQRIALIGRSAALALLIAFYVLSSKWPSNAIGAGVIGVFLALGLGHLALLAAGRERPWQRYALVGVDAAALGALAAFGPLSVADDVPQIMVFRVYGAYFLFLVVAVAALSLSPGLVLWAGIACVGAMWAAWGWIVAGMERTVTWADLPTGPTAEQYLALLLSPDFVGAGNRVLESLILLAVAGLLAAAVQRARRLVRERAAAERRRRRAQDVFGRYVPEAVAAALIADEGALAPQTREASVLFVDIAGFTQLAEGRTPAEVIALLNEFFGAAAGVIGAAGGVVLGFAGDAVIAAFNVPAPVDAHAARAIRAGRALLALAVERRFAGERLVLRVGVATGPVAAGSVGGAGRSAYTVYGDTVNLAQRLEALNKEFGTSMLVCGATRDAAGAADLADAGTVTLRGRSVATPVFAAR